MNQTLTGQLVTINPLELSELERALLLASPEISEIMLRHAGSAPGIIQKSDGSMVTEIDRDLEKQFRELVAGCISTPYFFLGEEGEELSPTPIDEVLSHRYIFVCDPIDGTTNFIAGSDWYGSLLALYEKVDELYLPIFGSIIVPQSSTVLMRTASDVFSYNFKTSQRSTIKGAASNDSELTKPQVSAYESARQYFRNDRVSFTQRFASIADGIEVLSGNIDIAAMRGKWWDLAAIFAVASATDHQVFSLRTRSKFEGFSIDDFSFTPGCEWSIELPLLLAKPKLKENIAYYLSE